MNPGIYAIFYAKSLRDVGMGKRFIDKQVAAGEMENPFTMKNYHYVNSMWCPGGYLEDQLEFIFMNLQADHPGIDLGSDLWNGIREAAIKNKSHMSMSVGDVIFSAITKKTYMVDSIGFVEVEFENDLGMYLR